MIPWVFDTCGRKAKRFCQVLSLDNSTKKADDFTLTPNYLHICFMDNDLHISENSIQIRTKRTYGSLVIEQLFMDT